MSDPLSEAEKVSQHNEQFQPLTDVANNQVDLDAAYKEATNTHIDQISESPRDPEGQTEKPVTNESTKPTENSDEQIQKEKLLNALMDLKNQYDIFITERDTVLQSRDTSNQMLNQLWDSLSVNLPTVSEMQDILKNIQLQVTEPQTSLEAVQKNLKESLILSKLDQLREISYQLQNFINSNGTDQLNDTDKYHNLVNTLEIAIDRYNIFTQTLK